jgi:excisionase family DNA binding protein
MKKPVESIRMNDAAREAGVCRQTVRAWIADGHLRALRMPGRGSREIIRIERQEWDRFKAAKRA